MAKGYRPIPGLWKQKPEAWGPVEAVQLAISHNAEKIGINPANIVLAMPLWSPGSQQDYSLNNLTVSNYNADFVPGGLDFSGSTSAYLNTGSPVNTFANGLTVIASSQITTLANDSRLVGKGSLSSDQRQFLFWMDADGSAPGWAAAIRSAVNVNPNQFENDADAVIGENKVVFTYATATRKISKYINGTLTNSAILPYAMTSEASHTVLLARAPYISSSFYGIINHCLLFSVDLSADQIAFLNDYEYVLYHRQDLPTYSFPTFNHGNISVDMQSFAAAVAEDSAVGTAEAAIELQPLTTTIIDAQTISVGLEPFETGLGGPAVIGVDMAPFTSDLTGNAVSEVSLPLFSVDDGILLHEREAWTEPVLPYFESITTSFSLCAISPFVITIDHTKITEPLGDFPVRIHLCDSAGVDGFDASAFFYALESAANRLKFSVVTADMTTQCYVEIEPGYDFDAYEMNLWVKVPFISPTEDTVLYLFFDKTMEDNTAYIGDTGSAAAASVWDSGFKAVYHMSQNVYGSGKLKDSTHYLHNSASDTGFSAGSLVSGLSGQAVYFNGDSVIACPNTAELDITGALTVEALINPQGTENLSRVVCKAEAYVNSYQHNIRCLVSGKNISFETLIGNTVGAYLSSGAVPGIFNENTYIASTVNPTIKQLAISCNLVRSEALYSGTRAHSSLGFTIGNRPYSADGFSGLIDEVRISNIIRSEGWVNATYYSLFDQLLKFDCAYTPESVAEAPFSYHHSAHVYDCRLPYFQAYGLTNANLSAILPYFKAYIGYAGEIGVELPYFYAACDSESEILTVVSSRLPYFRSELSGLVEKIITGECSLPRFQALLNGSTVVPSAVDVQMAGFLASVTGGHSVSGSIGVLLPHFHSAMQASSRKAFMKLQHQTRYWE